MESRETYAIRVCGPMITQNLDPMDVLDSLLSDKWVTDTEYRHIHWLCSRGLLRDASVKLLELLRSRPMAFESFVRALDSQSSFLAAEIRKHHQQAPDGRRQEQSLSDLRETLVDGAVPDVPLQHITRRQLSDNLTNSLRTLAGRFRIRNRDSANRPDSAISTFPTNGSLSAFTMSDNIQSDWSTPPTNAWLLVHGMAGCGKTVLCTSALRRNPGLLAECFPGGVIWLQVGSLTPPTQIPTSMTTSSAQLIALIDRLERKLSPSVHYALSEHHWPDYTRTTPLSHSPPVQVPNVQSSANLHDSLDRLRRALLKRQQRTTWGPDEDDHSTTALLLIVLDDVWDVQVGHALCGMPAAFLVTSRDQNVLQYVETPVDRFPVSPGLSEDEVAQLLGLWTNQQPTHFLPTAIQPLDGAKIPAAPSGESSFDLSAVARLCYGLPFAVSLLGHLLREQYHRLSDYMCDPIGSGSPMLNWLIIRRPSAYGYDTVLATVRKSLSYLAAELQTHYEQLVIFEPKVVLTAKVISIWCEIKEDIAEYMLSELARFSLANRIWLQSSSCYGYFIHALQLDLLKLSVSPFKQAAYHAQFIANYEQYCSGRWGRLIASGEHVYFWQNAIGHVFKSGRFDKLADLMTNLEFLRGRLTVLGTSPVIAEFNRYRAVFATLDRMDDWHAYLRFIQTNAYFVVDRTSVQPVERGRSPYRTDSRALSSGSLDSISPVFRADTTSKRALASRAPTAPQGPKGLDLIQLGLGLSQNSPVFQQAIQWLIKDHQLATESKTTEHAQYSQVSEYYWFWCNSHVAASQLVWAIPTGTQAVTCLTTEPTLPDDPSVQSYELTETDLSQSVSRRFRERFLAATRDGRVLLLDAISGYEVAVQQTYPPDVEVKFLGFLSNNKECLTCGSNGSMVVSTLPPSETLERAPRPDSRHPDDDGGLTNGKNRDQLLSHSGSLTDLMGGLDVDVDDTEDTTGGFYDTASHAKRSASSQRKRAVVAFDSKMVEDGCAALNAVGDVTHASHPTVTSLPISPRIRISPSTVLAEIPRLTEVVRVERSGQTVDLAVPQRSTSASRDTLYCIAAPPSLNILVLSCQHASTTELTAITLPSVYFLKRTKDRLYLDCSRQLRLPPLPADPQVSGEHASEEQEPEEQASNEQASEERASEEKALEELAPKEQAPCESHADGLAHAVLATVSVDSRYIAVALANGNVWIYSLDLIGWVACLSTLHAVCWTVEMDIPEDRKRSSASGSQAWKRRAMSFQPGATPSSCLFLPLLDDQSVVPADSTSDDTLFVAAVTTHVFVWKVPDVVLPDESRFFTFECLSTLSKPLLSLSSSSNADVLCLDACVLAGQHVLAGGTTSGRVLFWRVCDGCRLFELSAHANWVTSIRLLPPSTVSIEDGNLPCPISVNNMPMGVLTASEDGVIKRWDVGAACLPSPTTPLSVGPAWPSPSTPALAFKPSLEYSDQSSTALHGLWTDVFSVWFGAHGSLVVVGRRRHSADLQFLFRAQQLLKPGGTLCEHPFTFQEITMKPSQPYYWRPGRKRAVALRPPISGSQPAKSDTKPMNHGTTAPTVTDSLTTSRSPSRPPMGFTKHWIATTGLSGTFHGRATAVSFLPCGHWVAVGFSTGIVQIFSLHFDDTHLFGIVKRYCLVDTKPVAQPVTGRSQSVAPKPVDRVIHLHTWQSTSTDSGSTLIVVAVFASGAVAFWHVPSVSYNLTTVDSTSPDLTPEAFWPPMHCVDSTDYRPGHKLSEFEVQSRVMSDTDVTGLVVPVTWSTLRSIPHWSRPPSDHATTERRRRTVLVWLTAGYDGTVHGRQVVPSSSASSGDEALKRPNREFLPWLLDLAAHQPCVITDADVDPTGQWLVTVSTDRTAKIWSLSSGSLVFETAKHPDCVRSVCFRPVLDDPPDSPDTEWFMATGDDSGALRIWSLTRQILQDVDADYAHQSNFTRAVSPDSYGVVRPLSSRQAEIRDASAPGHTVPPSSTFDNKHPTRRPSPELKPNPTPSGVPVKRLRPTTHIPPRFHSNAAGYGSTWLRRLIWSPDGRLLTGLSDRLCVWPFEPPATSKHEQHIGTSPLTSSPLVRVDGGARSLWRNALHRCRVLRVLSSGVCEAVGASLHFIKVSPRRHLDVPVDGTAADHHQLTDLPPTLVTVDVNTGTLYIFDPIGALFRAELND